MAPTTDSSTEVNDAAYLLDVFATLPEFKGEWNALAVKYGVHITTASRRFKAIAKRHGYSYENGKVIRDEEDAITGNGATETPKKAKGKQGPKAKAIPTPKKRKLFETTAKDAEDIVKTESYVTAVSADEENKTNSDEKDIGEDVDEEIRNDNGDDQARAEGVKQKSDGGNNEETAEELA